MNLLFVADDPALDTALRALGHEVTVAADGQAALATLDAMAFDAVILDRLLPSRLDGIEILRQLRDGGMTVPVIMLASQSVSRETIEGLEAGADDYVVKSVDAAELHARLVAVLRGRHWTAPGTDAVRAGDIVVSPTSFRAWRDGKAITLGKLELNLLAELARNADAVLTRAVLVERVWGYAAMPDSNIVDVYIRRLRLKLTEAGGDDPIRTVRGVGYTLRG